jgi:ribosomal protein S27E
MWRIVEAYFDVVSEAKYECDLCGDTLIVPAGGVHPPEC